MKAAEIALAAWVSERGGTKPAEDEMAISMVREFIQRFAETCFVPFPSGYDADRRAVHDRAGYLKGHGDKTEYFIFPEVFQKTVCVGMNPKAVARALSQQGHLVHDPNELTRKVRLSGHKNPVRLYVVKASILTEPGVDNVDPEDFG